MKWNSRRVSAWAYAAPTDLRKGFDGLSALVLKELSRDPVLCQNSALLKGHGCNLMHRKVLVSFYQHLMAEAPMRSV